MVQKILIPYIKKLLEQIIVHHPYLHQILITHRQFIIAPVSTNINTIAFTKPTVDSVTKNDIVNIDINFMSRDRNDYKLDFNKRVFLRNRDLTKNTSL